MARPRSDADLRRARPREPAAEGPIKVRREVRRGKSITTIFNTPLSDAELRQLGARLKKRCGVGGTVKDGVIELQGDHRDVVVSELEAAGHAVVRAGG